MSKPIVALSFLLGILGFVVALSPLAVPGGVAVAVGMLGFFLVPLFLEPRAEAVSHDGDRVVIGETTAERRERLGRILGAILFALFGFASLSSSKDALGGVMSFIIGGACFPLVLWGVAERWRRGARGTWVTFERATLTVTDEDGAHVFAYRDIEKVEAGPQGVWLDTRLGRTFVRTSDDRRRAEQLAKHIDEKRAEAKERFAADDALPEVLRRPRGLPMREWLARLDGVAAMARDAAYRATTLDDEALLGVLGDAKAEVDARVAAARLLSRRDEISPKIRVALSAIDDDAVRVRVEAASKAEVEAAAAELEAIETQEILRAATE